MLALRSKLRRELLAWFLENRAARAYVRQLAGRMGADSTNVSRELARMEQQGVLVSEREGRQLYYWMNRGNPHNAPLLKMLEQSVGVEPTLRRALADISGLQQAFLYGSFAKGNADANSDIDILLIGDPDQQHLAAQLRKTEKALGRQINYTVLTFPELRRRLTKHDPFLTDIWQGLRIDLIGNSQDSLAEDQPEAGPAIPRRRAEQGKRRAKEPRHR